MMLATALLLALTVPATVISVYDGGARSGWCKE